MAKPPPSTEPIAERKRLAVAAYVAGGTSVAAILERYRLSHKTLYRALSAADIRRRRRLSAKAPAAGKRRKGCGKRQVTGERLGGRYYRLLRGEPKARCNCCHEMFQPYSYDYQECRRLCLYCYTGQWRKNKSDEE